MVSFKKVYYDKRCTSLNSKKLHACSHVLNYSCPLILQISYLASTLPSLSNCNWFSKKEAFGVFQFTSCLSRYQKTNLFCSAGHIYLPPPGTCPCRWPHASADSNRSHATLSRKNPLTLVSKKQGYTHPAHRLMPKARASHQPLFTFYISILELRGV